jgi:hypothetical protein
VVGRLHEDDLEGRSNVSLEEMASKGRSIEAADHDMGVHLWPLSFQGDVAGEGEHLDLLVDAEPPIFPFRDVEVAEDAARSAPIPVKCAVEIC